jgi:hypothetical protein
MLSEERDHSLSLRAWFSLRAHLVACRMCRIYSKQIGAVGRLCREAAARADADSPAALSEERKRRIRQAIEKPD